MTINMCKKYTVQDIYRAKSKMRSEITLLRSLPYRLGANELTHWGRDEMNNISQMTFSNVFFSMKMFEFRLKLHWSLLPRVQLTIFQHWFRWWFGTVQATSHYLKQWWLVYRRIYASLGLNELRQEVPPPPVSWNQRHDNWIIHDSGRQWEDWQIGTQSRGLFH